MNHPNESALAWALLDAAAPYLSADARVGLTTKIGGGEPDGAIVDLLTFYADTGTAVPRDLLAALHAWVFGYSGAPDEARLRRLVERIPRRSNVGQQHGSAEPSPASADSGAS